MLHTGARIFKRYNIEQRKAKKKLTREGNFCVSKIRDFEDVPRGSAILENPGASNSHAGSDSKTDLKGKGAHVEQ